MEGEDRVLEVVAKKTGKNDTIAPNIELGDVGSCEFGMCEEVSWEEVVEVIKYLKYGKALSPDGIKCDVHLWECKIGGCAAR